MKLHTCGYEKTVWIPSLFIAELEKLRKQRGISYGITLKKSGLFRTTIHFWMSSTERKLRNAEKELGV